MSHDPGHSEHQARGLEGLSPEVAHCVEVGERLSRTPNAERDLRWHVLASQVGDMTALLAARLRAPVNAASGH